MGGVSWVLTMITNVDIGVPSGLGTRVTRYDSCRYVQVHRVGCGLDPRILNADTGKIREGASRERKTRSLEEMK